MFESGFCVAKRVVELEARDVYGGVLIKKRQYCPNNVPGNDIEKHFEGKEVESVDCLEMKIYEGKELNIHCMKEPYYAIKLWHSG